MTTVAQQSQQAPRDRALSLAELQAAVDAATAAQEATRAAMEAYERARAERQRREDEVRAAMRTLGVERIAIGGTYLEIAKSGPAESDRLRIIPLEVVP